MISETKTDDKNTGVVCARTGFKPRFYICQDKKLKRSSMNTKPLKE